MWLQSAVDILILAIACEALVQLWLKAAPLQPARAFLRRITPFLYSETQGHLLDCPYCLSVWVGFGVVVGYLYVPYSILFFAALGIHRCSNFIHLIFSFVRDWQMDIRIARNGN